MPVNAGKRHFWEYCPCRYLPVNTGGKCHRLTLRTILLSSGFYRSDNTTPSGFYFFLLISPTKTVVNNTSGY